MKEYPKPEIKPLCRDVFNMDGTDHDAGDEVECCMITPSASCPNCGKWSKLHTQPIYDGIIYQCSNCWWSGDSL